MARKVTGSDIAVCGGGPTALCAALECARLGMSVVLIAPKSTDLADDARTTALMMPAIKMLKALNVWEDCEAAAAPLQTLRIIDDTKRLFRAPSVDFHASEIEEEAFGYNIPNKVLNSVLSQHVKANKGIKTVDAMVSAASFDGDNATLLTEDGAQVEAKLIVAADGVHSIVRKSAGIDVRKWSYEQTACVLAFDHSVSHQNISTEFHTPFGPFTQVPLPGNRSSLVWVMKPDDVDNIKHMSEETLAGTIEKQMQSMLGKISNVTKPQAWPLSSLVAHRFAHKRMVLIGQAAHAFPPIGAQGLNLGFRDIADLSISLAKAHDDAGAETVTDSYNRARRADVYLRTGAVDALNRSLLSGFLPLQLGRAFGMSILKNISPLRALVMRQGIMPGSRIKPHKNEISKTE